MTISYFHRTDGGYVPGEHAAGPWAPDMLHGRLLGGLAARAVEADHVEPGRRVARLTVDLFRPAGFDPVTLTTRSLRRGRRIEIVDVLVRSGGHEVASVRAAVLATGEPPPGTVWRPEPWRSPPPETLPPPSAPDGAEAGPTDDAWDIRIHEGGFGTSERARVWTEETGHLVDDEPVSPLVRAALSGDLASPLANGSDRGIGYINADYTRALARSPIGSWVGLETTTHLAAEGIAVGIATLHDLDGPFATSTTTALANPLLT